jgi:hypothetical protein
MASFASGVASARKYLAVRRDVVAGVDEHEITLSQPGGRNLLRRRVAPRLGKPFGRDVLASLAQRVGLRFAAAFGHRLGEVREEDGEPEPERHGDDEPGRRFPFAGHQGMEGEQQGERAADLDDEHDRVADHVAGRELAEGVADGALDDRGVEERTSRHVSSPGARPRGRARAQERR